MLQWYSYYTPSTQQSICHQTNSRFAYRFRAFGRMFLFVDVLIGTIMVCPWDCRANFAPWNLLLGNSKIDLTSEFLLTEWYDFPDPKNGQLQPTSSSEFTDNLFMFWKSHNNVFFVVPTRRHGSAMETLMASVYSSVAEFGTEFLKKNVLYNLNFLTLYLKGYVYDCITLILIYKIHNSLKPFNHFHPRLQFTYFNS